MCCDYSSSQEIECCVVTISSSQEIECCIENIPNFKKLHVVAKILYIANIIWSNPCKSSYTSRQREKISIMNEKTASPGERKGFLLSDIKAPKQSWECCWSSENLSSLWYATSWFQKKVLIWSQRTKTLRSYAWEVLVKYIEWWKLVMKTKTFCESFCGMQGLSRK
jgi:hypothetical protein